MIKIKLRLSSWIAAKAEVEHSGWLTLEKEVGEGSTIRDLLVGIVMTAKSGKPLSVWVGSVSAYMVVTILSVLIGAMLGKYIKPEFVRYSGASIFVVIGLLMFFGKI